MLFLGRSLGLPNSTNREPCEQFTLSVRRVRTSRGKVDDPKEAEWTVAKVNDPSKVDGLGLKWTVP